MAFYLKPLGGVTNLDKLLLTGTNRMRYLVSLVEHKGDSDKLAESVVDVAGVYPGTMDDRLSHFTLLVLATIYEDWKLVFVEAESLLFLQRIREDMSDADIIKSVKSARRHLREYSMSETGQKWTKLYQVVDEILSEKILEHWLDYHRRPSDSENICQVEVLVPFEVMLSQVSARSVELIKGNAVVNCQNFEEFLCSLFATIVNNNLDNLIGHDKNFPKNYVQKVFVGLEENKALKDHFEHMFSVFATSRISKWGRGRSSWRQKRKWGQDNLVKARDVETLSKYFPPCMANIHKILDEKNKLKHNDRFQYSLFLKEIGLDVDEALVFWRNRYSTKRSNAATSSLWTEKEVKYSYGIRHMYGLEGKKVDYPANSCLKIQKNCQSNDDLHCPLVDMEDLAGPDLAPSLAKYQSACRHFLGLADQPKFDKPSQCFQLVKKHMGS